MLHIVFADDHGLVREGIIPFLEELDDDVTISEADNLDQAVAAIKNSEQVNLILLDLKMPGMNGFEGLKRIKTISPDTPIAIISGHYDRNHVMTALDNGVSGYIPKTIGGKGLINALQLVLAGEKYLPPTAFTEIEGGESEDLSQGIPGNTGDSFSGVLAKLSNRERQVLNHLVNGQTNKEIARNLELQEITVKIHVRNIYRKIGASNRAQAVKISLQAGWSGG